MDTFIKIIEASPQILYVTINLVVAIPALLLALWRDKSLRQHEPGVLGFKWGYFTGFRILLVAFVLLPLLLLTAATDEAGSEEAIGGILLVSVVLLLPGLFIVLRHRWAWIFYTVCSMNPVLWMINGAYIKNRWKEFSRVPPEGKNRGRLRPPSSNGSVVRDAGPQCSPMPSGTTEAAPVLLAPVREEPPPSPAPPPPPIPSTSSEPAVVPGSAVQPEPALAANSEPQSGMRAEAPPQKKRMNGCLIAVLVGLFLLVVVLPIAFYIAGHALVDYAKESVQKSPLYIAVAAGNIEEVDRLLAAGANPDEKAMMGHSPLIMATRSDRILIAQRLLKAGADPNQKDSLGWAPLHHAVKTDTANLDMITILVESGAELDVTDGHLRTPLHRAAQFGHVEAVELLLRLGADPVATDENGWTPLDRGRAHPAIVNVLGANK